MTVDKILNKLSVFDRISFVEENHLYKIDGEFTNSPSVTRLLKKFKKEFDKEAAAAKTAKRLNTTVKQVLADWEINNLYSTTIGTMLHKYIENSYLGIKEEFQGNFDRLGYDEKKDIAKNFPLLVKQFKNFHKDYKHLECIKNEIMLGDVEDTKICGMSDMLIFNNKTKKLEILDFKTNKRMEKKSKYGGKLLYPFDDMYEGELNEYAIQLNTYKYFVESYTDLKIDKIRIIWFNVKNTDYQVFDLQQMQPKIIDMFNVYKSASLFAK